MNTMNNFSYHMLRVNVNFPRRDSDEISLYTHPLSCNEILIIVLTFHNFEDDLLCVISNLLTSKNK